MGNMIDQISQEAIDRYSVRFKKLGYSPLSLGWGSRQQQEERFAAAVSLEAGFNGRSVLDIGCGFGDFFRFLRKDRVKFSKYTGWDINPDLIAEAKKHLPAGEKNVCFKVRNILDGAIDLKDQANIVVMLGLLNFNLKTKLNNYRYSQLCLKKAFSCAREVLIVDFLSDQITGSYPKEDFVFYHDPCKMLKFALTLSNNVILKHNYAPIPQKEFMLFIFKKKKGGR